MSKPRPATVLIVKCATSGFSPTSDVILEICCILVDAATTEVLDTTNIVIQQPATTKVPDFHGPLLAECVASPVTLARAEGLLMTGDWSSAGALCSRALDFHTKFLAHHMPLFFKSLKWCAAVPIELKGLELLATARGAAPYTNTDPKTYRASDEACAAYAEFCHWTHK